MRSHAPPVGLDLRAVVLGRQHLLLGAAGPAALLPADLGDALRLFAQAPQALGFQPIQQQAASQKAVQRLKPLGLAAHLQTAGPVAQDYAGGDFIGALATGA